MRLAMLSSSSFPVLLIVARLLPMSQTAPADGFKLSPFPVNSDRPDLPPAILLLGPTASGKTAMAMAMADRFPVELISIDSALVFQEMNIGTAKPDAATLQRYPHALVDIISPEASYSAARFCEDALAEMAAIRARGRVPLLVGGTMLYVKALLEGLADLPQANPAVRARLEAEAAEQGWPALHARLAALDPETAARLAPHDSQRLQRALEVIELSGKPMSALLAAGKAGQAPYRFLPLVLEAPERSILHERIAQRFRQMLAEGLIEEVEYLRSRYDLNLELPSMRCVGYRQVWEWQDGAYSRSELTDRGIFATRQLAKRQITWINSMPEKKVFDCMDLALEQKIAAAVDAFITG